jgi:hypothetical protein
MGTVLEYSDDLRAKSAKCTILNTGPIKMFGYMRLCSREAHKRSSIYCKGPIQFRLGGSSSFYVDSLTGVVLCIYTLSKHIYTTKSSAYYVTIYTISHKMHELSLMPS